MRWGANRSGRIPTTCSAEYGVHLEFTDNALSVEWDAEYAPVTDITVTSWLVDTTLHFPFLHVSVKYKIIIYLFYEDMIEVYKKGTRLK